MSSMHIIYYIDKNNWRAKIGEWLSVCQYFPLQIFPMYSM